MQVDLHSNHKSCEFSRKRKLSAISDTTQSTDDENNCQKCISPQNGKIIPQKKYKTQLCKNFSETGSCPYRKKCKFAHGLNELNDAKKQQGKFYRTKKCNSFWNDGICSYGQRCQFMHLSMQRNTKQYLQAWKVSIEMQTNESGFAGSKLLRLLKLE